MVDHPADIQRILADKAGIWCCQLGLDDSGGLFQRKLGIEALVIELIVPECAEQAE